MKKYISPKLDFAELAIADIITLSTGDSSGMPNSTFEQDKSGWLPY